LDALQLEQDFWIMLQNHLTHRIVEEFELEGTVKGHLVQPPAMGRDVFS